MDAVGGWQSIRVCSGWRSEAEQESIYQSALAEHGAAFTGKFVAKPGQSEHQTGLAIDLGIHAPQKDALCPEFPDSGICRVLRQKAAAFGWIERYPLGKENITKIAHEPWHFRYVGFPHAAIMAQRSLTLEEYIEFVKQFPAGGDPLDYARDQGSIYISYIPAEKNAPTSIEIDPRFPYSVSGNHVDGFILTEWRIPHDRR
jgi:D-alanyl-D-alanine dipeptidase/carboxypeptidase